MSSSDAQGQRSSSTPSSGITGGYNGNSLAIKAVIAVFAGLSIYNAIELIALVFITFTRYKGVFLVTAHRVLGGNTVHPWFPFEVHRGHYQLGQVYKRVSAHDRDGTQWSLVRLSCYGVGYICS